MKYRLFLGCLTLFAATFSTAASVNNASRFEDQVGYSFGYIMGRSNIELLQQIDVPSFIDGLKASLLDEKAALSNDEMLKVISEFKQKSEEQEYTDYLAQLEKNKKAGQQFLQQNAKKSGVVVTKSGLQYQVLQKGTGKKPKASSTVKVNYEGRLLDGTVFDSSIARQQPIDFKLNQVIDGWKEGLALMNEGAKYRFFIPANLAYGEIGSGNIEPNSTLIFDVELLKVQP